MFRFSHYLLVSAAVAAVPVAVAFAAEPAQPARPAKARSWTLALMAYTFRQRTLLETIDQARALGLQHLEAFSWHKIGGDFKEAAFNQDATLSALAHVKNKLDEAGVRLSGFYFHDLGKDESVTRKVFDFCKVMDIPTIVCEPPPEAFDLLEKLANEYRINVAVHNHPGPSPYADPEAVRKVVGGRGPRIGACADTGHWVRSGLNPVECLRKYKGKIISLHLKDVPEAKKEAPDVPWGTGIGDVKAQLEELDRQGFSGVFSIEYESNPEDPAPDVRKCIEFFRDAAKALGRY